MKRQMHYFRLIAVFFVSVGLLLTLSLFINGQVKADTPIYVRTGGNDVECDGTDNVDYSVGLTECAVQTIQHGVDIVDVGGTVEVAAGTYTELITITKSVTLLGAYRDVIPTDWNERGGPGSETIIRPPTVNPTRTNLIMVMTDTVTINGFMLDGNNPALGWSPEVNDRAYDTDPPDPRLVYIHASAGVSNGYGLYPTYYLVNINELTVSHNIIMHVNHHGVGLQQNIQTPGGDNLISNNYFYNILDGGANYGPRRGVLLGHSQYASVTNNKMSEVYDSIIVVSYANPNPGTPAVISNNELDCENRCIQVRIFFGGSSAYSVSGNIMSNARQRGLWVDRIRDALVTNVSDNTITDSDYGVYISGGTPYFPLVTMTRNTVQNNTRGVYIENGARLTQVENNFITGNSTAGVDIANGGFVTSIFDNDLSGNGVGVTNSISNANIIDASGNWWGSPMVTISDTVDYTPRLDMGTDTSPDVGFQGDFGSLTVAAASPQSDATGRITEGLDDVDPNGTVNILAGTYTEDVDLNQNATLNGSESFDLVGNLSIQQGEFVVPSGSMGLTGNFSYSGGTFSHNGGTVELNGSSAQSIGGTSSAVFNNLTLDNASGASLGIGSEILGALTLTDGLFTLGAYDLTMGPAASVLGTFGATEMIVADGAGRVCKQYDSIGAFTYPIGDNTSTAEYSPAVVDFTSGTFNSGGAACVNLRDEQHPGHSDAIYLTRYWTVESSDITGFSADVEFTYVEADVVGDEGSLLTAKYDGGTWTSGLAVNTASNLLSMDGIGSFSDFTGKSEPTAVTLASFGTTGYDGMVLVEWETLLEINLLGYNIYRSTTLDGAREMINSELIPSGSNSVLGADYQFEDTGVLAGETYYYWLEMVGIYGPEMLAGPASTTVNNYLYMPLVVR